MLYNVDTNMYVVKKINEQIVGISGNVTDTKLGKILYRSSKLMI